MELPDSGGISTIRAGVRTEPRNCKTMIYMEVTDAENSLPNYPAPIYSAVGSLLTVKDITPSRILLTEKAKRDRESQCGQPANGCVQVARGKVTISKHFPWLLKTELVNRENKQKKTLCEGATREHHAADV